MSRNSPLVSIIVPAYNAKKYIHETIESVIKQTYESWELIVVDDGSTDATSEIVSSFDDKRIHIISKENGGVSSARNRGIELAKGKYITFLDADDVLPSQSLESRVGYLELYPEVDLVDGIVIGKDDMIGSTLRTYLPYYEGELLPRLIALDDKVFLGICYMFRRKILGSVRFREGMTHAEDLLFYIELASRHSVKYSYVNEEVYWYRGGHGSAMSSLKGLEDGYVMLVVATSRLPNLSLLQKLLFRLKIAKIMFLSWLGNCAPFKAINSTYRILFGAR